MALSNNEAASIIITELIMGMGPDSFFVPCEGGMLGLIITPGRLQVVIEDHEDTVSFKCESVRDGSGRLAASAVLKEPEKKARTIPTDMDFFWQAAAPVIFCCLQPGKNGDK